MSEYIKMNGNGKQKNTVFSKLFGRKKAKENVVQPVKKTLKIGQCVFSYENVQQLIHGDADFVYQSETCKTDFFKKELIMKYNDDIAVYKDENGRLVLRVHESIPTFDSGDRQWNSYKVIYIIREKTSFTGIYLTGGYQLADAKVYKGINCGDENTKAVFESMGMI